MSREILLMSKSIVVSLKYVRSLIWIDYKVKIKLLGQAVLNISLFAFQRANIEGYIITACKTATTAILPYWTQYPVESRSYEEVKSRFVYTYGKVP